MAGLGGTYRELDIVTGASSSKKVDEPGSAGRGGGGGSSGGGSGGSGGNGREVEKATEGDFSGWPYSYPMGTWPPRESCESGLLLGDVMGTV